MNFVASGLSPPHTLPKSNKSQPSQQSIPARNPNINLNLSMESRPPWLAQKEVEVPGGVHA